jgi:CHAD domain-containing protein
MLNGINRYHDSRAAILARGDQAAVHDARVALRCIATLLEAQQRLIDKAETVEPVRQAIRRLARRLGSVRDLDVIDADTRRALAAQLATERAVRLAALRQRLTGPAERRTMDGLLRWLATGAWLATSSEVTEAPARKVIGISFDQHWRKLRRQAARVLAGDRQAIHPLRLAVKRLRYLIEELGGLYDDKRARQRRKRMHRRLIDLQDRIGALTDRARQRATLAAIGHHAPAITATRAAEPLPDALAKRLNKLASMRRFWRD